MEHWAAAADKHGIIELAQLYDAGLDVQGVRRLVRGKELTRLARGWFSVGVPTDDCEQHRLATRAMLRSHGGRAVASYHSALLLLGLPTYGADLSTVRLSRVTAGPPRTRRGLCLGRAVPPEMVLEHTVHPALAAVQVGMRSGPMAALIAADGALYAQVTTREDIADALQRMGRAPGVRALGRVLQRADGRRASPGETRLGEALHLMGHVACPQLAIRAPGLVAYADFAIEDEWVVVEFDGAMKYGQADGVVDHYGEQLASGEVVAREKAREDRIRELGWEVVRVTWAELGQPLLLAAKIQAAIARSRARRTRHLSATPV